jgi:hypothetical protein
MAQMSSGDLGEAAVRGMMAEELRINQPHPFQLEVIREAVYNKARVNVVAKTGVNWNSNVVSVNA